MSTYYYLPKSTLDKFIEYQGGCNASNSSDTIDDKCAINYENYMKFKNDIIVLKEEIKERSKPKTDREWGCYYMEIGGALLVFLALLYLLSILSGYCFWQKEDLRIKWTILVLTVIFMGYGLMLYL